MRVTGYMARAKIIALMAEQHIDATRIARRMGLPREFVISQLGGRRPLTLTELKRFADILDVPLQDLTEGAWYGCPDCGAIGPEPTHTPTCTSRDAEMLPAVPR